MPVDRGGVGGAGYQLAPGTWRELLRDDCDRQCRPDARLLGEPDFKELKAAGAARSAQMFRERLAAGDPITVAASNVPGRNIKGAPDWLRVSAIYGGASMVRIHRDDIAEAAEFFGDMSGQVWERIPVPAQHRPDV
jgi:hypothetical protein